MVYLVRKVCRSSLVDRVEDYRPELFKSRHQSVCQIGVSVEFDTSRCI